MGLSKEVIDELLVAPGKAARLDRRHTDRTRTDWLGALGHDHPKDVAELDLERFKAELAGAQELLYASGEVALLIVFQALDAAGKDGTINHVMSGVNPQGSTVTAFKRPTAEEARHDFLWRGARALPERGRIAIFNRSYYEDVLIVRVHPELLGVSGRAVDAEHVSRVWGERFEDINAFEQHLHREGTRILKFFLHVSKEEQTRRFLDRLEDPAKQWKFTPADLAEREYFDDYMHAFEEAISATSTSWAPWYVIPADHKHAMRALVGGIIAHTITELGLRIPVLEPDAQAELQAARETLRADLPPGR